MPRYVAFLRGMNLGGRRITNDQLVRCFEQMDLSPASAFLASGNVLFDSSARSRPKLEAAIATGLKAQLKYEVPTFIRSAAEVAAITNQQPFTPKVVAQTAGKLQVALLSAEPSAAARKKALAHASADDHLAIVGRELYWLPKAGMSDSELPVDQLAKHLGAMTIRTHRTITRLAAKLAG